MSINLVELMNTILGNGSAEYQNYVPVATRANIATVANPILTYQTVQNEFLNALVNKIAMTIVRRKMLTNPLAPLKKGDMALGQDIEEVHVNRAKATTFDPTGAGLLTRSIPDVAVMYHRLNRRDEYDVTISKEQLKTAFTSWDNLQRLLDGIVSSMYDGDSDDEYILMKNLMSDAVTQSHIVTATLPYIRDASGANVAGATTKVVEELKNASAYMGFAGSNFNKYHLVNAGATPRRLKTENADQILIIRADLANSIDVNVLASAFNLDKAQFLANRVIVDNFGAASSVGAFLCDKDFFQVYDNLRSTEEFFNPKGLYWNYFYHVWQTVSYSLLVNAIAFTFTPIELAVTAVDSDDVAVTGTATKSATVTVEDETGTVLGSTTADASTGAYSVTIEAQDVDTVLTVKASLYGEVTVKTVTVTQA